MSQNEDRQAEELEQRDKESRLRSILKAFTWRIIATATTMTVTYFVTGDLTAASVVGVFDFFLKMMLYYLHERGWQMVPRGSIRQMISPFSRGE